MQQGSAEIRFVERLLGWLEINLPTAPPNSTAHRYMSHVSDDLVSMYGVAPIGRAPRYTLDDATEEVLERLRESGAEAWVRQTDEQWAVFGAGLPFSQDELADASARSAHEWLPNANGRPRIAIAQAMHACGAIKGALVQAWRR